MTTEGTFEQGPSALDDAIIEDQITAGCGHRVEVTEVCDDCEKCSECCQCLDRAARTAVNTVKSWLHTEPVYLDIETTGLDENAEICDIAVVGAGGVVLFDTLVKPTQSIPAAVTRIHGITDEMVKDAPGFGDIADRLAEIVRHKVVVIYDASFDTRLLEQSAKAAGVAFVLDRRSIKCAMLAYAEYYGDWNDYHQSYRWQKLESAAINLGITPNGLHRARTDAELTRLVCEGMGAK